MKKLKMKTKPLALYLVVMFLALTACGHAHHYSESIITPASCKSEGLLEFKCECGDSYTEIIPKESHDYVYMIVKEATCKEAGEKRLICKVCQYTETETIPAAHQYNNDNKCVICGEYREGKVSCHDLYKKLQYKTDAGNSDYIMSECTVTAFQYEWIGGQLTLVFDIRKDSDVNGATGNNPCSFMIVVYDKFHNVVYSERMLTKGMVVKQEETYYTRLDRLLDGTSDYTVELSDYVF